MKHEKIEGDELMLTETQMKKLEPLADRAAEHLQINVNPVYTFAIVSCVMYSSNLFQLKAMKSGS